MFPWRRREVTEVSPRSSVASFGNEKYSSVKRKGRAALSPPRSNMIRLAPTMLPSPAPRLMSLAYTLPRLRHLLATALETVGERQRLARAWAGARRIQRLRQSSLRWEAEFAKQPSTLSGVSHCSWLQHAVCPYLS